MIEKHFIGQLLWDPNILTKTVLTGDDFMSQKERTIFEAIKSLFSRGEPIEELPVSKESKIPVSEIMDYKRADILSSSWKYFEEQILERSKKAKIKLSAENILSSDGSATDLIRIFEETTAEVQNKVYREVKDTYTVLLDSTERYKARKAGLSEEVITTGISKLDYLFGGFKKRKLYYVGARPSQGKSALLMNFMTNTQKKALFLSAESSIEEISDRILIRESRVDSWRFQKGKLTDGEMEKLEKTSMKLGKANNYFLYYDGELDMHKIRAIATTYKKAHDVKIIFIDYLQLIVPRDLKLPRHEQVAEISKGMKVLANDLNLPVVCAAQLRRDAEEKRPKLSDFSDSTQIERDADVAMMIYNTEKIVRDRKVSFLCVQKNRDGQVKDVAIEFQSQFFHFQTPPTEVEEAIDKLVGK